MRPASDTAQTPCARFSALLACGHERPVLRLHRRMGCLQGSPPSGTAYTHLQRPGSLTHLKRSFSRGSAHSCASNGIPMMAALVCWCRPARGPAQVPKRVVETAGRTSRVGCACSCHGSRWRRRRRGGGRCGRRRGSCRGGRGAGGRGGRWSCGLGRGAPWRRCGCCHGRRAGHACGRAANCSATRGADTTPSQSVNRPRPLLG